MLKASEADLIVRLMTHDDQQFFKELGARIAQLRKEAGLSQQAVADALEIPQQTYANYEVARARPAVSMLPTLAQLFGISVDELLGVAQERRRQARTHAASAEADRAIKSITQGPAESGIEDARRRAQPGEPLKITNATIKS